jgi:hypothetical protein
VTIVERGREERYRYRDRRVDKKNKNNSVIDLEINKSISMVVEKNHCVDYGCFA